jgi:hypothetical protein
MKLLLSLVSFCLCLIAVPLFGGVETLPFQPPTENGSNETDGSLSYEFAAESAYVGEADIERGDRIVNDFDETNALLRFIVLPRVRFGILRLGAEWERFSFGLPDGTELPDELQALNLIVGLDTELFDSILIRFEVHPGLYGTEFDHIDGDQFNVPFILGGTYIYNSSLQFVLGIVVNVEARHPVLAGGGVRWKIAPQWVLNAVLPTPRLEFELNKNVTLYVGADFKQGSYRVGDRFGDSNGNTRLNHAVITYTEVRTGAGVEWELSPAIKLSAEVGYLPYRDFDFHRAEVRYDEDGVAPYGMISLHGAF